MEWMESEYETMICLVECHVTASSAKSAFEHAQKVQIQTIVRVRKVLSGHLLSIQTFCNVSNDSVSGQ